MKSKTAADSALMEALADLEGRRLARTCPLTSRCYGDVLAAAFTDLKHMKKTEALSPPPSDDAMRAAAQS